MNCPICFSINIIEQSPYRNTHICFQGMKRVLCTSCSFQFVSPMPSEEELEAYNNSYHDSAHGGQERDIKAQAFFSGIARTRLHFIEQNISLSKENKYTLIEIGPGPGAFAAVWLKRFPNSTYYAIETDVSCHEALKNLGVTLINPSDIKSYKETADFIVMSHVLEHVIDPFSFLNYYLKMLKHNGHVFVEIPCNDWQHKDMIEPHLLFFDKKPMYELLKRLEMVPLKVSYYGTRIRQLNNPISKFFKQLRRFLFRKGITYYHPQKRKLKKIGLSTLETNALVSFDAHMEQSEPSWWLRVLFKK